VNIVQVIDWIGRSGMHRSLRIRVRDRDKVSVSVSVSVRIEWDAPKSPSTTTYQWQEQVRKQRGQHFQQGAALQCNRGPKPISLRVFIELVPHPGLVAQSRE
jgi:hypothetical protein